MKNKKTYRRRPQIKKFIKRPLKSGNYDQKHNFKIFKNVKYNQKYPPKVPKYQKHREGGFK